MAGYQDKRLQDFDGLFVVGCSSDSNWDTYGLLQDRRSSA